MFSGSVAFTGPRSLATGSSPAVLHAVEHVSKCGGSFSVGCSLGADASVIQLVLGFGLVGRLSVFSAFGPVGAGSLGTSAVGVVGRAAGQGATMHWWAGGAASVPASARLVGRSLACIRSASALVGFVAGPPPSGQLGLRGPWPSSGGSGSWSSVGAAALLGLRVVIVPVAGWSPTVGSLPALPSPCGGAWSAGPLAGSWLWSPAPGLFG